MFTYLKRLTERYYEFWLGLANLKEKVSIFSVDFKSHWTSVLWSQKIYLIIALACESVIQTFYTIYPLLVGWIIESQKYQYFGYLMLIWLSVVLLEYASHYYAAMLEIQCINSIQYNAFVHFLTVDPKYHAMKASGKLFAKIERCARAYEDLLDIILWDVLPIVISMVAVVFTFLVTDTKLGLTALCLLLIIALINIALNLFTSTAFEKKLIEADDKVKVLSVESLTQVQLIRSSFATAEIAQLGKKRNSAMMIKEGTGWLAFAASTVFSRVIYLISVFILGTILFNTVTAGTLSILSATTLLLTYINGTYEIIQIGRRLRKLIKSITRIQDLYSFIQKFGRQTFPVLPTAVAPRGVPIRETAFLSIQAQDLHFDYNPKAKIFEDHNLTLTVPLDQANKLYGVIGPSGMGKTTLLSLLGGQLHPERGTIIINGVPIYSVSDEQRRSLIALQGQIASNLSGTVRRSLLLGLPYDHHIYDDTEIIEVLKEVGIWGIFEEKEGLNTQVGEAGLTLSGGQRQRLNFAALYLRALYFKPALILIDEPTSSLDEVSERAITRMISSLAQRALTLVIAHRIKTLDNAIGILDFSLLDGEKEIVFYSRNELEQRSSYYKKLIQGTIEID
jgi:ABC-type multidrug transport system fused ATPase/permease subunit